MYSDNDDEQQDVQPLYKHLGEAGVLTRWHKKAAGPQPVQQPHHGEPSVGSSRSQHPTQRQRNVGGSNSPSPHHDRHRHPNSGNKNKSSANNTPIPPQYRLARIQPEAYGEEEGPQQQHQQPSYHHSRASPSSLQEPHHQHLHQYQRAPAQAEEAEAEAEEGGEVPVEMGEEEVSPTAVSRRGREQEPSPTKRRHHYHLAQQGAMTEMERLAMKRYHPTGGNSGGGGGGGGGGGSEESAPRLPPQQHHRQQQRVANRSTSPSPSGHLQAHGIHGSSEHEQLRVVGGSPAPVPPLQAIPMEEFEGTPSPSAMAMQLRRMQEQPHTLSGPEQGGKEYHPQQQPHQQSQYSPNHPQKYHQQQQQQVSASAPGERGAEGLYHRHSPRAHPRGEEGPRTEEDEYSAYQKELALLQSNYQAEQEDDTAGGGGGVEYALVPGSGRRPRPRKQQQQPPTMDWHSPLLQQQRQDVAEYTRQTKSTAQHKATTAAGKKMKKKGAKGGKKAAGGGQRQGVGKTKMQPMLGAVVMQDGVPVRAPPEGPVVLATKSGGRKKGARKKKLKPRSAVQPAVLVPACAFHKKVQKDMSRLKVEAINGAFERKAVQHQVHRSNAHLIHDDHQHLVVPEGHEKRTEEEREDQWKVQQFVKQLSPMKLQQLGRDMSTPSSLLPSGAASPSPHPSHHHYMYDDDDNEGGEEEKENEDEEEERHFLEHQAKHSRTIQPKHQRHSPAKANVDRAHAIESRLEQAVERKKDHLDRISHKHRTREERQMSIASSPLQARSPSPGQHHHPHSKVGANHDVHALKPSFIKDYYHASATSKMLQDAAKKREELEAEARAQQAQNEEREREKRFRVQEQRLEQRKEKQLRVQEAQERQDRARERAKQLEEERVERLKERQRGGDQMMRIYRQANNANLQQQQERVPMRGKQPFAAAASLLQNQRQFALYHSDNNNGNNVGGGGRQQPLPVNNLPKLHQPGNAKELRRLVRK